MANAEQREHWDGAGGQHWVAERERYDRMVEPFGDRIVEVLDPRPGERILDVGCGNGALSLSIARLIGRDGAVTGLDISGPMLAAARGRAEHAGLSNVSFEQADAQIYPLVEAGFDCVVSRFGVMFFDDPEAAFKNLRGALRPGGRMAFTCWQEVLSNDWLMVPVGAALAHVPVPDLGDAGRPGPFSLADPGQVDDLLAGAGFVDVEIDGVRAPMWLGSSVEDAVSFMKHTEMAETLMTDIDAVAVAAAWDAVQEAVVPYVRAEGLVLDGAAWLVSGRRDSG